MEYGISRISLLSQQIHRLEANILKDTEDTGAIQNEGSQLLAPQPSQRDLVWKYTTEIQAHHANKHLIKQV